MSGGTYEVHVTPPWGMGTIADGAARLGASSGSALSSGVADRFLADVAGLGRLVGTPATLGHSHSRLGGAVTGLVLQTSGGLRVNLELEAHPQPPTHDRQYAVRATVPAGQQVACHDEGREIMQLFRTIAHAGWSFAGPVVEHPPGGAAAQAPQLGQEGRA